MCGAFKDVVQNHDVVLPSKRTRPGSEVTYRLEIWPHKGKGPSPVFLVLLPTFFCASGVCVINFGGS